MNLWESYRICNCNCTYNTKISFHYEDGVDRELKQKYIDFANWLRKNYVFPVRLHVYILNREKVALKNGKLVYGKFSWYPNRTPNIKIPSAVESDLIEKLTLEEIHESILSSLVHELTHYYQYVKGLQQSDSVSERQADFYRYKIIDEYYENIRSV